MICRWYHGHGKKERKHQALVSKPSRLKACASEEAHLKKEKNPMQCHSSPLIRQLISKLA
jgi:hypothetical protein